MDRSNKTSAERRILKTDKEIIKRRKQERRLAATLLFLISFSIILIIAIICIGCSHNHTESNNSSDIDVTVDYGDKVYHKKPLSSFLIDNVLYVNFTDLAAKCEMTITGSSETHTFSVKNESQGIEYITFQNDSINVIINDVNVQMNNKAVLKDGDIWVSADFISSVINGIIVTMDTQSNTLYVKRAQLNASTPTNPIYEPISFKYNVTTPSDTITDNGIGSGDTTVKDPPPSQPKDYGYVIDMTRYEEYIDPQNRDDYLIIANRENRLSSDFVPKDLTLVYKAKGTSAKYKMTYVAAMAFEALVKEAEHYNLNIYATSGYRSYQTQETLFNNYVNGHINNDGMTYEQAFAEASTYSQIAGASEHQTGLTMDVNWTETSFGSTKEGKWLAENCWKYGFIIRYPKDKQDVTGISWEPWHLRYVGRYHAEKMHEMNLCLEEYLEYLDKH